MPTKLEREKKFLVKFPTSWAALADLLDNAIDIKRINQTYLKAEPGEQAARVRQTIGGLTGETETLYHFNQKKPVSTGVHEETEHEISKDKYEAYLKKANPTKCAVEKTRFVFKWHDQVFELDLFKGHLKGLAILEIELDKMSDKIELPEFLPLIKEITDDKSYSNFALADKERTALRVR